jgi:DNA mismatch endonuclease (patch repair protein)
MAAVKASNTKPEVLVRSILHRAGFRFTLKTKQLPGKPDIYLPKFNAVIFVNGCFWHGHDCYLFKWPETREEFWRRKITGNRFRDHKIDEELTKGGIRIATVWECALRGKVRRDVEYLTDKLGCWLKSNQAKLVVRGLKHD